MLIVKVPCLTGLQLISPSSSMRMVIWLAFATCQSFVFPLRWDSIGHIHLRMSLILGAAIAVDAKAASSWQSGVCQARCAKEE